VIKFVSDLRQVDGFLRAPPVSSTNKTDRQDIAEILLKVALRTIKPIQKGDTVDNYINPDDRNSIWVNNIFLLLN